VTRRLSPRQQLAAVYAKIPAVDCTGRCANTCTTFPVPRAERREVRRHTGTNIGLTDGTDPLKTCPLLTDRRRCGAHSIRPLICRIWGVTEGMICPHGCRPARTLTLAESFVLMADVYEIGGQHGDARQFRAMSRRDDVGEHAPLLQAVGENAITLGEAEAILSAAQK
jgi:hypothetical protein